jgi:hypothetical protein
MCDAMGAVVSTHSWEAAIEVTLALSEAIPKKTMLKWRNQKKALGPKISRIRDERPVSGTLHQNGDIRRKQILIIQISEESAEFEIAGKSQIPVFKIE